MDLDVSKDREKLRATSTTSAPATGDHHLIGQCFSLFAETTRERVLHELLTHPALDHARPDDWLRQFYVHAAGAFSALTTWCDAIWLEDCLQRAAAEFSPTATTDELLSRVAPSTHPAVLDVLKSEIFERNAPSTSVRPPVHLPWDVALRRGTFELLVAHLGAQLECYLRYAWLLSSDDATAYLEAALIKAWQAFGTTHPSYDFVPWLITIVRRHAAQAHRRALRPPSTPQQLQDQPAATETGPDGDESADDDDDDDDDDTGSESSATTGATITEADIMVFLLCQLSPRQRECLVLAELAGFTSDEIARVFAIPASRVARHVRLARRRFTEAFARTRTRASVLTSAQLAPIILSSSR